MPGGSLHQLSSSKPTVRAKVGQDETRIHQEVYLTENPKKNFFRIAYKRFYNFAKEEIRTNFNRNVDFGAKIEAHLTNYGHYLREIVFRFSVPALTATSGTYAGWTQSFAQALVEYAELKINGITFDTIYGMAMDWKDELSITDEQRSTQNLLIGRVESLTLIETNATEEKEFMLRIPFSFSKSIERALPLLLLEKSKITVELKLRPFSEVVVYDGATPPTEVSIIDGDLITEVYYLDERLKKEIIQESKDRGGSTFILYEQIQFHGEKSVPASTESVKFGLTFNNPLKEIVVVLVEDVSKENNDWFNYARRATSDRQIEKIRLLLDNHDRFNEDLSEKHFRFITSARHHTRSTNRFIYSLPLCEFPEEYQPSGVLNASRYDDISLWITMRSGNLATSIYPFGISYQLLVIQDGVAGLGWSD